MIVESIRLNNFRVFKDVTFKDIPRLSVLVGENGAGKSTLFSVFEFLRIAMASDVNEAFRKIGGPRGFDEVRSHGSTGPIEIELKFRETPSSSLATYFVQIEQGLFKGKAEVKREVLKYRRGTRGEARPLLSFSCGSGYVAMNERAFLNKKVNETELEYAWLRTKSRDMLALRGLSQFDDFCALSAFGSMIESCDVFDLSSTFSAHCRSGIMDRLAPDGSNLHMVLQYLHDNHPYTLQQILSALQECIPSLLRVESKIFSDGRFSLQFKEEGVDDALTLHQMSAGVKHMLMYLTLLHQPYRPIPLCLETPEASLHPTLIGVLVDALRGYVKQRRQAMVITHSPALLDSVKINEVFYLSKNCRGFSTIKRASSNDQIAEYISARDKMGHLWKQGLLEG